MVAVDTDVLVRLVTRDDPAQTARVERLFRNERVWISKTVLLETEWVLRSLYGFDEKMVLAALTAVLGLDSAEVEDADAVMNALAWCEAGLDFADALHLASRGAARRFVTLDEKFAKRARRVSGAKVARL